jgi:hypothetical protein
VAEGLINLFRLAFAPETFAVQRETSVQFSVFLLLLKGSCREMLVGLFLSFVVQSYIYSLLLF